VSAESIDKRHSRGLNGRQTPNRAVLAQRGAPWTKTRLKALRLDVLRTNGIKDQNGNSGLSVVGVWITG
jgi:hypothetical protein